MEFDDERFLTLVFQYPCIYDNHDPNYKNGDSREICWADIGNEMHCNDIEFLKKKWDISKEKFRRIRKRMIRSDQPSLANEWPLYHVMHNYFDQFIKTRNRLRASDRREMENCQGELGASHHSENSLLVESKLFVGSNPYVHHDLPQSGSTACVDGGGETSSFVSLASPVSSSGHHSDNLVEVSLRTPKSKKLKRSSSEANSSALLCEAMKLWSDSIQQTQRNNAISSAISPVNPSTDEITLYCLSYAARLKTLPSEAVDDIRCQMENLMREARLKFK